MSLDPIDPFPWFLSKPMKLVIDDQEMETRITASQWDQHWRPFLARLRQVWLDARPRRVLVGIAGPPGAGKSIFAEQLQWISSRGIIHREVHSAALPMDGFHFPQKYLESHDRKLPDGNQIPLATVKGQIDTFDVPSLRKHLKLLSSRPNDMTWPAYSRRIHDVIPNHFNIHSAVNLVFIEGNYLLLDRGPFAGIPALFDLRIYMDIPAAKIMGNLMSRHIARGRDLDQAKEWVKRNDLPNARLVESTRANADVIVQRDLDAEDLSSVTWKEDPLAKPSVPAVPAPEAPAAPFPPPPP